MDGLRVIRPLRNPDVNICTLLRVLSSEHNSVVTALKHLAGGPNMRMALAVLLNSLLILSVPTPLLAKGKTVKITIKGTDLKTPIEISDPKILANFKVWTGPGTSTADRQSLIIDWSQGPVRKPPESLRRYQVSFHTEPNEQIVYVVYYAFSPGAEQGYVYLPGESDEWHGLNVRSVARGVEVEGKWFRAWSAWERVARPLIEKAEVADSIQPR